MLCKVAFWFCFTLILIGTFFCCFFGLFSSTIISRIGHHTAPPDQFYLCCLAFVFLHFICSRSSVDDVCSVFPFFLFRYFTQLANYTKHMLLLFLCREIKKASRKKKSSRFTEEGKNGVKMCFFSFNLQQLRI